MASKLHASTANGDPEQAWRTTEPPPESTQLATFLVPPFFLPFEGQLFAAPAYLERRGTPETFADLARHSIIQFRNVTPARPRPRRGPSLLDLPHRIVADDFSFVRAVLRAGAGIGLLPTHLVRDDLVTGTLTRVLPRFSAMRGVLYLLYPATRPVPRKVTIFRDFILDWLKTRPLSPS